MKEAELIELANQIDNIIKEGVETHKTKVPMKVETSYKKTFDMHERQLISNIKDKNIINLFKSYKDTLIQHLLEIRDNDCLKIYAIGLGISTFAEIYAKEKKKSE